MIGAFSLATHIRGKYELGQYVYDEDLEAIAAAECCDVLRDRKISVETGAFYAGGKISVARGLPHQMYRWLLAHELCHHLRHRGAAFHGGHVVAAKKEHDAEVFAGWLLLTGADVIGRSPADVAGENDLPEERVARWLGIVQGRGVTVSLV